MKRNFALLCAFAAICGGWAWNANTQATGNQVAYMDGLDGSGTCEWYMKDNGLFGIRCWNYG